MGSTTGIIEWHDIVKNPKDLPKSDGKEYIVTVFRSNAVINEYEVWGEVLYDPYNGYFYIYEEDGTDILKIGLSPYYINIHVVAWAELPEPYIPENQ